MMVAPMLTLMLMILGGFYVNYSSMPSFIRWLSWLSQARYAFTAMVVNEFKGRTFECAAGTHARYGASCPLTGEEVIDALEMDDVSVSTCFLALVGMQTRGVHLAQKQLHDPKWICPTDAGQYRRLRRHGKDFAAHLHDNRVGVSVRHHSRERSASPHAEAPRIVDH